MVGSGVESLESSTDGVFAAGVAECHLEIWGMEADAWQYEGVPRA